MDGAPRSLYLVMWRTLAVLETTSKEQHGGGRVLAVL
jgi:hypothetical protein